MNIAHLHISGLRTCVALIVIGGDGVRSPKLVQTTVLAYESTANWGVERSSGYINFQSRWCALGGNPM